MAKATVEERLDIQELFAKYRWALNTGDIDGFIGCFAPDGWVEHFPPKRFVGPEELREMAEGLWYGKPFAFMGRQHHPNNFLITRTADGIQAKVYWSGDPAGADHQHGPRLPCWAIGRRRACGWTANGGSPPCRSSTGCARRCPGSATPRRGAGKAERRL